MTERKRLSPAVLLAQSAGALLWGALIAVAPLDLLPPVLFVGVAALFFLDIRRVRRYGAWPLLPLRYTLISAVVAAAILWGPKADDTQRVDGLAGSTVPLGELARAGRLYGVPAASEGVLIRLPSATPTYREMMRSVEAQTDLVCVPGRCANGMSLLNNGYIMSISVAPRNPEAGAVVR